MNTRGKAMLRATPPQPKVTCPGTESAGTNGAVNAAEMSMFTPPITVTYSLIRQNLNLGCIDTFIAIVETGNVLFLVEQELKGFVKPVSPAGLIMAVP